MKRIIAVFAGGGSGGHLYPGLAVAKELKSQMPNIEICFVGSDSGLEAKIIPQENYTLYTIPVHGLIRTNKLQKLKSLSLLPFALLKSVYLILKIRPTFVLGIGGFASGPFTFVSAFMGFRTYIWEPNAHPGFTNRILSHFVKKAFVVFDQARSLLKSSEILTVGLPIRNSIVYQPRTPSQKFRVLVFGGSQGARPINYAVVEAVKLAANKFEDIEIVHQTGRLDFCDLSEKYKPFSNITCLAYLDDMPRYYRWSDMVICRAGVGTISELIAARKAAVVIPLPTAAEDHQRANAEVLTKAGAGEMLLQKDMSPQRIVETILHYKSHPELIMEYEKKLALLSRPSGATAIVGTIRRDLNL